MPVTKGTLLTLVPPTGLAPLRAPSFCLRYRADKSQRVFVQSFYLLLIARSGCFPFLFLTGCASSHGGQQTRYWKNRLPGRQRVPELLETALAQMGLQNTKHPKVKQANILMLGLDSAGKSTLLYKFKYNDVCLTTPTIGFNVDMIETGKDFTLTLWDVGGQQKMRQVWCSFLENVDVLLYVVDSSDKRRLEESKREFKLVLRSEFLKSIPVIVLANKQDLPGALNAEELTRRFHMKKHCSDRTWYVQPCCAATGEGLAEALQRLTAFAKQHTRSNETSTNFKEIETL